jgi:ABC-2 type transport system ATP-binding protein
VQAATPSELNDIADERRTLLEMLRSGDFTTQRKAFERLSALAENYFPKFLGESVALTSDANQLDDRIRKRTIALEDQLVEKRHLVTRAVELLSQYNSPLESNATAASRRPPPITNVDEIGKRSVISRERQQAGTLIIAHKITKTFAKSSFQLHPISLEINRGEILGIVGINASGKTTLLRMLLGEIAPSSGSLLFPAFEKSNSERDWKKIKLRIGYVSQILPVWPGKLYDNLCYSASVFGHPYAKIDEHLDLLLKRYGLDKFKDSKWSQLSGGYKARFEIARVLLSNPDVLILDEPLAYLDIITQQIVLRQLRQLSRSRSHPISIVLTSQQLYEIEAIADRLLVLDGGNILYSGKMTDLSNRIACVAIEFGTLDPLMTVRGRLEKLADFRTLFGTETGFIALFERPQNSLSAEIFARAAQALIGGGSQVSYIRDISGSSRLLFEPAIADELKSEDL